MQRVTFKLDGELLAIPTSMLREILEPIAVTRVPQASPLSSGLINVRGTIVPLIDLRVALRLPRNDATEDTRFLVLELPFEDEIVPVAVIAESVHDVIDLDDSAADFVPTVGSRWPPEHVHGIARHGADFITLPRLETLFDISAAGAPAAAAS